MRRISLGFSVLLASVCSVASAASYNMQDFAIYKGGGMTDWSSGNNVLFYDEFEDGISPPSAPNFTNGTTASYAVTGSVSEEAGCTLYPGGLSCGGLTVNPDAGLLSTNAVGASSLISGIRLNTNIDTSKPTAGLNIGSSFMGMASFGLSTLPTAGYSYGVRLSDAFGNKNDVLDLRVVGGDTSVSLVFSKQDFISGTYTVIDSMVLTLPVGDSTASIDLALVHGTAGSNEIQAMYGYYSDYYGACIGACLTALGNTSTAFNGEDFTRFEARAIAAVPEPAGLAMMLSGLGMMGMLGWRRTRRA